jgi:hypothetical protein
MNSTKQKLYIYIIVLTFYQSCCGLADIQKFYVFENCFTKEAAEAIAPIVANATEKGVVIASKVKTGLVSLGTGLASIGIGIGVGLGVLAIVGGGYLGYHLYCNRCAQFEEAKLARELFEREMRIKEEQARIALEIMQKNAKLRSRIIIGTIATIASTGIGYAIYRLYKSIVTSRQQKQQEQELFVAKHKLLDTLATTNHEAIGGFGLPASCNPYACNLLALPGGKQALTDIVSAYNNQTLQPDVRATILTQQN